MVIRCFCFDFQKIIPSTIIQEVQELFIPQNEVEMRLEEASKLPVMKLSKVIPFLKET